MQKNLLISLTAIILFLGVNLVQADNTEGESPRVGLGVILKLYKEQRVEEIVRERCLDKAHATSKRDFDNLIESLRSRISSADSYTALISTYEAALISRPRYEDEGRVAIFSSPHGSVTLSKMDTGVWGIRL